METITCEICGAEIDRDNAHYYEDGGYYVCPKCHDEHFVTCERCGAKIPLDDSRTGTNGYLCEYCHDELYG